MPRIDSLLRHMVDLRASDLHLCSGGPPMVRHDGDLSPLAFHPLSDRQARRFLDEIMTEAQRARFRERHDADFVHEIAGLARFRVNCFEQSRGLGAVFRFIPETVPTCEGLHLPERVRAYAALPNGLVLITGPTGSGKSTTLAAIINEINAKQRRHIITIEDPVEYVHTPILSLVTQREVGTHVKSFEEGLRSALRESPDVLVVGEMRDIETTSLALTATETGTLVFGTLHTSSAAKAVDRVIDSFPEDMQEQVRVALSMLMRGVVCQRLVKRADGVGRLAVHEVIAASPSLSHMIRDGKVHMIEGWLQSGTAENASRSLDAALAALVRDGTVALADALEVAAKPARVRELVDDVVFDDRSNSGEGRA